MAAHSPQTYEKYRQKFTSKKLFPASHPLLASLRERYDYCAKLSHPSVHSLAGRVRSKLSDTRFDLTFSTFELRDDDPSEPIRTLLYVVDTHFGILRVFEETLAETLPPDEAKWKFQRDLVDARIGIAKDRNRHLILT